MGLEAPSEPDFVPEFPDWPGVWFGDALGWPPWGALEPEFPDFGDCAGLSWLGVLGASPGGFPVPEGCSVGDFVPVPGGCSVGGLVPALG